MQKRTPGDRLILFVVGVLFVSSLLWLVYTINEHFLVDVPRSGGVYIEGIAGTPRFVNPVLAVTEADKSVTALVYSGLMQLGQDGVVVPDMAESVTVSEDGLVYNVILRDSMSFHDGEPVMADDVLFTVNRIQDPALKSPLRASFDGVTTELIGDHELNFVLPEPYAPFIENLTVGILPKHIWESATSEEFPFSQFNSEPIGSGSYEVTRIVRTPSGIPETYILSPAPQSDGRRARISELRLNFYAGETQLIEAFVKKEIQGAANLSAEAIAILEEERISFERYTAPLPRTFAIFFNQDEAPLFRSRSLRRALNVALDKEQIVGTVLDGYGEAIEGPIPPGFGVPTQLTSDEGEPRAILEAGGWEFDDEEELWTLETDDENFTLSFSIATSNVPLFEETASLIEEAWESFGAEVDVKLFEQTDLTQSIIRPRQYEALLFGTVIGRELDLFSFWHSSQRNDPGLNVALYANITTDAALQNARRTNDQSEREEAFLTFEEEIQKERPATFLFIPTFIYVIRPDIKNISLTGLAESHERFARVHEWYIEKESVWKLFTN